MRMRLQLLGEGDALVSDRYGRIVYRRSNRGLQNMAIPKLDNLDPPSIPVDYTDTIKINGDNFDSTSEVYVSNIRATIVEPRKPKQLKVQITEDISEKEGNKKVVVFNTPDGISETHLILKVGEVSLTASSQKIGILSSIEFSNTPVERSFKLGLGHPSWALDVRDDIGYSPEDLADSADYLCNGSGSDLVISFGGNISAEALAPIANDAEMPFLAIVGNLTPELSHGNFAYGGINLDTVARNAERFNRLTQELKIPAGEICFLSNPISAMAEAEQAQWRQLNPTGMFFFFDPSRDPSNVRSGFDDVFQRFARN